MDAVPFQRDFIQRLFEVPPQVFGVFHAYRQAYQCVGDAESGLFRRVHARVGHGGRVLGQRFRAAEADG